MSRKFWIIAAAFFAVAFIGSCRPKDSTDPPEGRSGMGLRIDHGTGCHYLTSVGILGESGITPRLDDQGRHVCRHEEPTP